MNFLRRLSARFKGLTIWLALISGLIFLIWLVSPPANLMYIIRADGQTYRCSRYEVDQLPATNFSVDDKGVITFVLTPTYNLRLYDWKPHHLFRVPTVEFTCKHYEVNAVTDHDPTKP